MNHFNHQNVQLAYEAVYNQDLCESMEDLGLIDGYDYLDESRQGKVQGAEGNRLKYYLTHGRPPIDPIVSQSKSSKGSLGGVIYHRGPERLPKSQRKRDRQRLSGALAASEQELKRARQRIISGASRGIRVSSEGEIMPVGESYDLYDIILEYLIQEGYADTLGSAEIILENMSEDWIEDIVEEQQRLFDLPPLNYTRTTSKDPKATQSPGRRAVTRADEHEQNLPPNDPRRIAQRKFARVIGGAFASARNPRRMRGR